MMRIVTYSLTAGLVFFCNFFIEAQEVSVTASYDTVYAGNVLAVQYGMENWEGDLEDPDFGEWIIAGGPQISSSVAISQGQRSSKKTILFYLKPPEKPGVYEIPAQKFADKESEIHTEPLHITVSGNPDGIKQNPVIKNGNNQSANRNFFPSRKQPPPRGEKRKF